MRVGVKTVAKVRPGDVIRYAFRSGYARTAWVRVADIAKVSDVGATGYRIQGVDGRIMLTADTRRDVHSGGARVLVRNI